MNARRYKMVVRREVEQEVEFIAAPGSDDDLLRIAESYCKDDRWEHVKTSTRSLTSNSVTIVDGNT